MSNGRMGPFSMPSKTKCTTCFGRGEVADPSYKCGDCHGARTIKEKKVIEVNIPPGVTSGKQYNFPGESDEVPGKTAGDLVVTITEKQHPVYTRKGSDLFMNKKITLNEALTGFRFTITHVDGRMHLVQSKPGEITSPGETKMYRDLGLPTSPS
jgi:DnaJ family protein A protein 2